MLNEHQRGWRIAPALIMEYEDSSKPDFLGVDWLNLSCVYLLHSSLIPSRQATDAAALLCNALDLYTSDSMGTLTSFLYGLDGMARPDLKAGENAMAANIAKYRNSSHWLAGLGQIG